MIGSTKKAQRFAEIRVGDQIMSERYWPTAAGRRGRTYWLVTDVWFDPVRGQRREASGQMVAIRQIGPQGEPMGRKNAHTRRGLANQGFYPADLDYMAHQQATVAAWREGTVVGIGDLERLRRRNRSRGL